MRYCLSTLFIALNLLLTACGGDEKPEDDAIFELPENKKPAGVSGDVEVTERTYQIKLNAPTPAWSVKIESVYVVGQEIWVICRLAEKQGGMVAQVITPISDSVKLTLPDISPEYYVIGPQMGPEQPGVQFIDSLGAINEGLKAGEKVWPQGD